MRLAACPGMPAAVQAGASLREILGLAAQHYSPSSCLHASQSALRQWAGSAAQRELQAVLCSSMLQMYCFAAQALLLQQLS